jgi:hypothetical protein
VRARKEADRQANVARVNDVLREMQLVAMSGLSDQEFIEQLEKAGLTQGEENEVEKLKVINREHREMNANVKLMEVRRVLSEKSEEGLEDVEYMAFAESVIRDAGLGGDAMASMTPYIEANRKKRQDLKMFKLAQLKQKWVSGTINPSYDEKEYDKLIDDDIVSAGLEEIARRSDQIEDIEAIKRVYRDSRDRARLARVQVQLNLFISQYDVEDDRSLQQLFDDFGAIVGEPISVSDKAAITIAYEKARDAKSDQEEAYLRQKLDEFLGSESIESKSVDKVKDDFRKFADADEDYVFPDYVDQRIQQAIDLAGVKADLQVRKSVEAYATTYRQQSLKILKPLSELKDGFYRQISSSIDESTRKYIDQKIKDAHDDKLGDVARAVTDVYNNWRKSGKSPSAKTLDIMVRRRLGIDNPNEELPRYVVEQLDNVDAIADAHEQSRKVPGLKKAIKKLQKVIESREAGLVMLLDAMDEVSKGFTTDELIEFSDVGVEVVTKDGAKHEMTAKQVAEAYWYLKLGLVDNVEEGITLDDIEEAMKDNPSFVMLRYMVLGELMKDQNSVFVVHREELERAIEGMSVDQASRAKLYKLLDIKSTNKKALTELGELAI